MTKICSRCGLEKELSCFSINKKARLGVSPWCKSCHVQYERERLSDPEKKAARHDYNAQAWASTTQEERDLWNARRRIYAAPRHAAENEKRRKRRADNPEIGKKQAKRKMERFHSDPDFRLKENLRARLRQALINGQKAGSAVRDLGCTVSELRYHLESKFQPGMTWENYGSGEDKWNIDHIIPLKYFTLSDRQHFMLANYYLNLQPLWSKDNFRKNDTYPTEYLASLAKEIK